MTESEPTTDRARRQRAVETGATDTAVDRVSGRMTPRVQQAQTTSRTAQRESKQGVANELDIDPSGVGSRSEIGGGVDVFLRSTGAEQFGDRVREQFAGEASFVEPADVTPNVNAREITANPQLASDRRDEVEQRAEAGTAADTQFVEPGDLDADVGARGVQGIEILADRRDDVEQRAVQASASDSEFLTPADLDADVGARGIDRIFVPEDRRDDVEQRAVEARASDSQFITPADLDADVGASGISGIFVPEDRRDDVADRVRADIAGDSRFVNPADVAVNVTRQGVESAGLSDAGEDRVESRQAAARRRARRRARREARQETASELDERFPDVDIGTGDISISGGQATLDTGVQKEIAADRFNDRLNERTDMTFNFTADQIRQTGDGFGLSDYGSNLANRAVAAEQIDEQITDVGIGFTSVEERSDGSFGITDRTETRIAAARIDEEIEDVFIGPRSVEETSDGSFGLSDYGQRRVAAADIADEIGVDVGADDVTAAGDGEFELTDDFIEGYQ
jgi:hypothetical protein